MAIGVVWLGSRLLRGVFEGAGLPEEGIVATWAATLFLGGYHGPGFLPGAVWLLLKMVLVFVLVLWVRWSFMRLRIDHAIALNWKILFPISMVNLLLAAWWVVRAGGIE